MRKLCFIIILISIGFALSANSLSLSKISNTELKVEFQLPVFYTQSSRTEGIITRKLTIADNGSESEMWKENLNGLPQIDSWVYVPDGYRAQIELVNPVFETRLQYECDTQDSISTGVEWIDSSDPMRFRGNTLQSFCVKPFQYDPASKVLRTLSKADIRIRFVADTMADYQRRDNLYTPDTVKMLRALCINRDDIRDSYRKPGTYVLFYNGTDISTIIQGLADWKLQKGYDVRMVNTSTIGNNTTSIKNYLQTGFDTWENPPEYIFILGRATNGSYYVPTYSEFFNYNTVGDYKYTQLDGTDLIPDAYIGRATFANTDELNTIVNRILYYEKYQNLATNDWSNRALMVADPTQSGTSCTTTINYIKSILEPFNPEVTFADVNSGYFPSQIITAVNNGVGAYWYRGHGDLSGWQASDMNSVNNAGKYPFYSYITCFTGTYGSSQLCMAERWLRLGTSASPRGAIGVICSSSETHTCTNNILTGGIAYGLYVDDLQKPGPALVRGKLALLSNFPQNPGNYLYQFSQAINLLGDPGVDLWLKPASQISVTYPALLYPAGGTVPVTVTDTGLNPIPGAWVCIYKSSELSVSGYTDAAGLILLPYETLTAGTAKLTVTKPNYRTFQVTLTVSTTAQPVTISPIAALNQCYAGSNISFPITLQNNGTTALSNVSAILQAQDEEIIVQQSMADFASMQAGESAVGSASFSISLSEQMVKGRNIYLNLHVTHTGGTLDLPILCTENGANFSSTLTAFNNDILAIGANQLNLTIHNDSDAGVNGLLARLDSTHPLVTIANPEISLGTVNGGATTVLPTTFNITVADTLYEGVVVTFYLELYNSTGFFQRLAFSKAVGTPSLNDITGPDGYGYVCVGPGDPEYIPYSWIELDPALGGSGTNLNLTDTDTEGSGAYSTVTLPFQLRYYGVTYSQVTITTNGYIMPGNRGSVEWMNWQIPGPMTPKPIIAPFWDDLITDNSSKILYKYDSATHAFIVQWQMLKNRYSASQRETFEVVLYDPVFVPTPTGDSPLLFQYKLFNNIDQGNYGGDYVDHGQYATVGIGDHSGDFGLEYTFNNTYPTTGSPLTNFTTLYFTTLPDYVTEPNPIILNYQIDEFVGNDDNLLAAGETIDMNLLVKNAGLGSLNPTTATLTSNDEFATITQAAANLGSLFSNQMEYTAPAFRIQIAPTCPNLHDIHFTLNLQNPLHSFDLGFDLVVHAVDLELSNPVFSDGNDGFPAPGETVVYSFDLQNVSLLAAANLVVNITPPPNVTASPLQQTLSIPAQGQQTVTVQLGIGADITQGTELNIGIEAALAGGYTEAFSQILMIGSPDLLFAADFEEPNPYVHWLNAYNISVDPSQYINPTGMEAVMYFPQYGTISYLLSPLLSCNDIMSSVVDFKYQNLSSNANLSLQVSYNGGESFQSLWSASGVNDTPQQVSLHLPPPPSDAIAMTYLFLGQTTGLSVEPIILDDVSFKAVHHAPGMISGHIILDLYPDLVSQVGVQQLFTNTVVYPDINGFFQMPAFAGTCYLQAVLPGYHPDTAYISVPVISGQTSAGNDITLSRLCAPINLSYTMAGNQIILNWDVEGQTLNPVEQHADVAKNADSPTHRIDILRYPVEQHTDAAKSAEPDPNKLLNSISRYNTAEAAKSDRYLTPSYFRIFMKYNNFTIQDTTSQQTYTRILHSNATYRFYVHSVYFFDSEDEVLSDTSNVIVLVFTPNDDNETQPAVFSLSQNQPNPFNPDTRIAFSLREKAPTTLIIYNLKGQQVKRLVDANLDKGAHSIVWDGRDDQDKAVASGVYYYRLSSGKQLQTRKMVLMK